MLANPYKTLLKHAPRKTGRSQHLAQSTSSQTPYKTLLRHLLENGTYCKTEQNLPLPKPYQTNAYRNMATYCKILQTSQTLIKPCKNCQKTGNITSSQTLIKPCSNTPPGKLAEANTWPKAHRRKPLIKPCSNTSWKMANIAKHYKIYPSQNLIKQMPTGIWQNITKYCKTRKPL
jgi:hypothetical protein